MNDQSYGKETQGNLASYGSPVPVAIFPTQILVLDQSTELLLKTSEFSDANGNLQSQSLLPYFMPLVTRRVSGNTLGYTCKI